MIMQLITCLPVTIVARYSTRYIYYYVKPQKYSIVYYYILKLRDPRSAYAFSPRKTKLQNVD